MILPAMLGGVGGLRLVSGELIVVDFFIMFQRVWTISTFAASVNAKGPDLIQKRHCENLDEAQGNLPSCQGPVYHPQAFHVLMTTYDSGKICPSLVGLPLRR